MSYTPYIIYCIDLSIIVYVCDIFILDYSKIYCFIYGSVLIIYVAYYLFYSSNDSITSIFY
jgi:hypothetical protein